MYEENQKLKTWITPDLATEYLAGAVLLGAAPCTAMVFVWSTLTKGNPAYTVVQVASNDIIILFAFVPIVKFLLGVSNVSVPFQTLFMSVVLSYQPEYHVYNTCIGVGEWLCFILFPDF